MNIEKELKRIVVMVSEKDVSTDDVTEKTILTDDLGYDSVKLITLIVEIESFFKINIADEYLDVEKLIIFGSLLNITKSVATLDNNNEEI